MCQAPTALHHKIIIPHATQENLWVRQAPTTNVVNPKKSLGRVRYDNFVMQRGWCLAHRLAHQQRGITKLSYHTRPKDFFGVNQAPTINFVNPTISLGRVRYDTFVMQRGWCLAHRLVASKFTTPTNSVASRNYHTARGVQSSDRRPETPRDQSRSVDVQDTGLGPWTLDLGPWTCKTAGIERCEL